MTALQNVQAAARAEVPLLLVPFRGLGQRALHAVGAWKATQVLPDCGPVSTVVRIADPAR